MGFQQGLAGLNAAARNLDVIGNNVANTNTVGFKSARAEFADVYATSVYRRRHAAAGIGVSVSDLAQQFTQGDLTTYEQLARHRDQRRRLLPPVQQRRHQLQPQRPVQARQGRLHRQRAGHEADRLCGRRQRRGQCGRAAGTQARYRRTSPRARPPPQESDDAGCARDGADRAVRRRPTAPATPAAPRSASSIRWDASMRWRSTSARSARQRLGSPRHGGRRLARRARSGNAQLQHRRHAERRDLDHPDERRGAGRRRRRRTQTVAFDGRRDAVRLRLLGLRAEAGRLRGRPAGRLLGGRRRHHPVALHQWRDHGARPGSRSPTSPTRKACSRRAATSGPRPPTPASRWSARPAAARWASLQSGALESSNVDLTAELVNMITAQRVYQANAQTIKTNDQCCRRSSTCADR